MIRQLAGPYVKAIQLRHMCGAEEVGHEQKTIDKWRMD